MSHRGYARLIVGAEVTGEQRAKLQRVQLEAGVLDGLRIFDTVFVHGQELGCLKTTRLTNINSLYQTTCTSRWFWPDLDYASKVAVGSQLQALPLRPGLDGNEPLTESSSPVVGEQARSAGLQVHQLVEQPSADKMEELREELNGEGRVNLAAAQEGHGVHQGVQHHLCKSDHRFAGRTGPRRIVDVREKASSVLDLTDANWQQAMLLRIDQESGQMDPQLALHTVQQATAGSQTRLTC